MDSVYNLLLENIQEKYIVDDILQMKAEMEHRDRMKPIIKNINDMVCFVFNTVGDYNIDDEDLPVVTKIIHHYKYDENDSGSEIVIFKFEEYEEYILDNINDIFDEKNEYFLDREEYFSIYDISN